MAPVSARTRMKCKKLEERSKQQKKKKSSSMVLYDATTTTPSIGTKDQLKCGGDVKEEEEEDICSSSSSVVCSTPKGKRFRIPEMLTCPPAPKKRKVTTITSCKRSPIAFFASPDIELFFFSAVKSSSSSVPSSTFTPSGV